MSNIDISDLVTLIQSIEHHKGKYIKQTLALLERDGRLTVASRKIILDGFNNFNRQIQRLLGYTIEN